MIFFLQCDMEGRNLFLVCVMTGTELYVDYQESRGRALLCLSKKVSGISSDQ